MDGLDFWPAHRQPVKDPGFISHQIFMHPLDGHHSQQTVLDIANHMIISSKVTVHIQHVNGIQSDSAWSFHAMIFFSQQCGFLVGPAQQKGKSRRYPDRVLAWLQFRPEAQGDTLTWTRIWKLGTRLPLVVQTIDLFQNSLDWLIVALHQLLLSGSKGRGTHVGPQSGLAKLPTLGSSMVYSPFVSWFPDASSAASSSSSSSSSSFSSSAVGRCEWPSASLA